MVRTPATRRPWSRRALVLGAASAAAAAAAGCAPPDRPYRQPAATARPVVDARFDLDALIRRARREGRVTVHDSSGDIQEVAKAFTAAYGIRAEGVKSDVGDTLEKMTREHDADNVTVDATFYEDGASLTGDLIAQHIVYTWIPADRLAEVPDAKRNPLNVLSKANVFVYNPRLFPHGCPVGNLWELTDRTWRGRVTLQDPLGKPNIVEFFNQLSAGGEARMRAAHRAHYGRDLPASVRSAALEWAARLARNDPILTSSDDDAAAAVGSPKQTRPRIGLVSNAKFRDVQEKNYGLRVCDTLRPWPGYQYPKYAAVASRTRHPNAAKLFVRFMLTRPGITHEMHNGGIPAGRDVPPADVRIPGLPDWGALFTFDPHHLPDDFATVQSTEDLWRINHH